MIPPSIYGVHTLRFDEPRPGHQIPPTSMYHPMKSTERTFVFSRDELDGFAKDKDLERKFLENFQVCVYCQDNMNDIQDEVAVTKFMSQGFEFDQIRESHARLEREGKLPRWPQYIDGSLRTTQTETSSSSSDL